MERDKNDRLRLGLVQSRTLKNRRVLKINGQESEKILNYKKERRLKTSFLLSSALEVFKQTLILTVAISGACVML